jgi:hypothetical protein
MGIETIPHSEGPAADIFIDNSFPTVRMPSGLRIKQLLGMVPADRHFHRVVSPAVVASLEKREAPLDEIVTSLHSALSEQTQPDTLDPRVYGGKILNRLLDEQHAPSAEMFYVSLRAYEDIPPNTPTI